MFESRDSRTRQSVSGAPLGWLRRLTPARPPTRDEVAELHSALEQARTERDARKGLLAYVSHQLRNPLTAVICWGDLLRDTQLSREQREMLETLQRSAQSLAGIVNNVLDFTHLDEGRLQLERQTFDLRECVEECLDCFAAAAAQKDIELACVWDEQTAARQCGDAARVRQVLMNLLSNAVKFTERGHVVTRVSSRPLTNSHRETRIAVHDTGPGIRDNQLETIFDGWAQQGGGLGLSISRRLATTMGGRLWAESALGKGSTFSFTFVVPTGEPAVDTEPVLLPALSGKRVLIVHDDVTISEILGARVRRWGGLPLLAAHADAALTRLRSGETCDLLIVDQHVVGMGGRALAAAARRLPGAAALPVVLMTSLDRAERDDAAASETARFTAYVAKPVREARLLDVLASVLTGAPPRVVVEPSPAPAAPVPRTTQLAGARILVVDDDVAARGSLARLLHHAGARVAGVSDGAAALEEVASGDPDVVLLHGEMPGLDGFTVCRRLKDDPRTRLVPIVLVTGLAGDAARLRGIEARAHDLVARPFHPAELLARVQALAELKHFTDGLDRVESVLVTMARCVEGRDPETHGHCERLADYASRLGRRLGLDPADVNALRLGGIVHDIGKVAVPDAVLYKKGPLTEEEWEVMKRHPVEGERICAGLTAFRRVLPIIRHHHERMDGSGYPDGLHGEDIPLTARVLQMVDVYDALRSRRPYKRGLSAPRALAILEKEVQRGWRDARVFGAFREMVNERR